MVVHSMVSLAGQYTKLSFHERTKKYYGKCPFCHSGSDVFCADNKNAVFYCYGCGRHGTKADFETLMKLKKAEPEPDIEEPDIVEIYEAAAGFYYETLMKNPYSRAYRYVTETRNLNGNAIASFGLGFAPQGYTYLYDFLKRKFDEKTIFRSGLVKKGKGERPYDMFRNRIMFPILNRNGHVVAFGGRNLDDDNGPKYLNSAESRSFNKHRLLYGFQTAVTASSTEKELVICEGYMDLIALQINGIRNSSAVLGTALTKDHAELIRCYYDKVCLALDSDGPGLRAAARSIPILQDVGIHVSVLNFKPAKDPDEFVHKFGREAFQERVKNGMDPSVFLVRASIEPEAELVTQLIKKM